VNFLNPYHFVPIHRGDRLDDLTLTRWPEHAGSVSHHEYASGKLSGRLVCRIEAEDPVFVGASRTKEATREEPATVEPFTIGGRPALPASALRGLFSSIAEAASNSAMRVLEDRAYSYRKKMEKNLSAIGMVFVSKNGACKLLPLTLPTLVRQGDWWVMPQEFRGKENWFFRPYLRVCFGDAVTTRDPARMPRTFRIDKMWERDSWFGMRLPWQKANPAWQEGRLAVGEADGHSREVALFGQKPEDNDEEPLPWGPEMQSDGYVKGIVRVLGCWDDRQIPEAQPQQRRGKYHELFLPCGELMELARRAFAGDAAAARQLTPLMKVIAPEAVHRFHELADERTEAEKDGPAPPYEPKDTDRLPSGNRANDRRFRLKTGDLVYFAPHDARNEVGEIALSSIWRDRVEYLDERGERRAARTWTFITRSVGDKELLPFNPDREIITIAEQMFGFVEADRDSRRGNRPGLSLAGRIRFTDAIPVSEPPGGFLLDPVTLKILDSPKPPSPVLYFRTRNGRQAATIAKEELSPDRHEPQGRKVYLHRQAGDIVAGREPWRTRLGFNNPFGHTMKQHVRITPVCAGSSFWFAVAFDNLSGNELGLLLYALRPTPGFRHKIGMGKPIGLGRIRVDVQGLFLVDRCARYTATGLCSGRYSERWVGAPQNEAMPPQLFPLEAASEAPFLEPARQPDSLRATFRQRAARAGTGQGELRLRALERLGETMPAVPVCYPFYDRQAPYTEERLYGWFARSQRRDRPPDALRPLDEIREQDDLPVLRSDRVPEPGH